MKIPCIYHEYPMKGISQPMKTQLKTAKWNFMVLFVVMNFPWKMKYFIPWAMNFILKKRHSWAMNFLVCLFFELLPLFFMWAWTGSNIGIYVPYSLQKVCGVWLFYVPFVLPRPSGLWFSLGFEPMTFCQAVLSSYLPRQPGRGVTNDSLGGRIFLVDDLNGVGTKNNIHATHK